MQHFIGKSVAYYATTRISSPVPLVILAKMHDCKKSLHSMLATAAKPLRYLQHFFAMTWTKYKIWESLKSLKNS